MEKTIFSEDYRVFLRLLVDARKSAGLTQIDLAKRLKETQSWVSKCERGERRLDIIEFRAFCLAIEIPFVDFCARLESSLTQGASPRRRGKARG